MPYSGGMNNALIVGVGDEDVLLEEWLMVLFTLGHIVPGDQKSPVLPRQASQWKPWG